MYDSSASGVAGYTPPQWNKRKDQGFLKQNDTGSAATSGAGGMFLQTGSTGPDNSPAGQRPGSTGPDNSPAGQRQRAVASMTPQYGAMSSAQGYAGGVRQGHNRTIGDPNFGDVAAVQNYLRGLQQGGGSAAYQQGAQYLRQNGLMPTYNGSSLDRLPGAGESALGYGATGNQAYSAQANQEWANGADARAAMTQQLQPAYTDKLGRQHAAIMGDSNGVALNGNGYVNGVQSVAPNIYGGAAGAYNPGGSGPTGLPLEGAITDSIGGILSSGGSPYSALQEQQLRNQSTDSIDQQYGADQSAMESDAQRRGLNPGEIAGSSRALAQGARNARGNAVRGFDLGLAQSKMGNRLSAIGAGTNLIGQQIANENSIRQYYAMLGASQNGAPLFLGGMK